MHVTAQVTSRDTVGVGGVAGAIPLGDPADVETGWCRPRSAAPQGVWWPRTGPATVAAVGEAIVRAWRVWGLRNNGAMIEGLR